MPVRMTETAIQAAAKKVAELGRMDLSDATLPGLAAAPNGGGQPDLGPGLP